jgi:hypothetical protein
MAKIKDRNDEREWQDLLNAVKCCLIVNMNRDPRKPAYSVEKFQILKKKDDNMDNFGMALDQAAAATRRETT